MKLTKGLRNQILSNVLNQTFKERSEALTATEYDLADRVYKKKFSKTVDLMNALPEGYLVSGESLSVSVDSTSEQLRLPECRRGSLDIFRNWHTSLSLNSRESALGREILEWSRQGQVLRNERQKLRSQVGAILESVTTLKRLKEVWPESVQYIPAEAETTGALLPAVRVDEVNKLIACCKAGKENCAQEGVA